VFRLMLTVVISQFRLADLKLVKLPILIPDTRSWRLPMTETSTQSCHGWWCQHSHCLNRGNRTSQVYF